MLHSVLHVEGTKDFVCASDEPMFFVYKLGIMEMCNSVSSITFLRYQIATFSTFYVYVQYSSDSIKG